MKKIGFLVSIVVLLFMHSSVFADNNSDDIIGEWYSEGKKSVVKIYKSEGKFFGKIIWLKDKLNDKGEIKLDVHNPDKSKRGEKIEGMEILKNFIFEDNEWTDGTIYDPKTGKTYSCIIKKKADNEISIRGYVGISLFGKTTKWTKKI